MPHSLSSSSSSAWLSSPECRSASGSRSAASCSSRAFSIETTNQIRHGTHTSTWLFGHFVFPAPSDACGSLSLCLVTREAGPSRERPGFLRSRRADARRRRGARDAVRPGPSPRTRHLVREHRLDVEPLVRTRPYVTLALHHAGGPVQFLDHCRVPHRGRRRTGRSRRPAADGVRRRSQACRDRGGAGEEQQRSPVTYGRDLTLAAAGRTGLGGDVRCVPSRTPRRTRSSPCGGTPDYIGHGEKKEGPRWAPGSFSRTGIRRSRRQDPWSRPARPRARPWPSTPGP